MSFRLRFLFEMRASQRLISLLRPLMAKPGDFAALGDFTAIFTACDFYRLNEAPGRRLHFGPTLDGNHIHHAHQPLSWEQQ
jgi:hypothetical protein